MPSKDWLYKNPKVSAHIPQELYQQLQEFMEQHDIESNAKALKIILNEYLNNGVDHTTDNSSLLVDYSVDQRLTTIESQIDKLSQQVIDLAKPSKKNHSGSLADHLEQESGLLVANSSPLLITEGWLTTGEAFIKAQQKGYSKTKSSMRRNLKSGNVPTDLERLGLVADWKVREEANPKDNSVR